MSQTSIAPTAALSDAAPGHPWARLGPLPSRPAMTGLELRRSTRDPLIALGVSLADEFSDRVPAGTVIRSVARAREQLLSAGVRAGLVVAVESMARARLRALASDATSSNRDATAGSARGDDVASTPAEPSSGPSPPGRRR